MEHPGDSFVFLNNFYLIFFEAGVLTGPELANSDRLAVHVTAGSSCLHLPSDDFPGAWLFHMGVG